MKSLKTNIKLLLLLAFMIIMLPGNIDAQQLMEIKNLSGRWKFSIGDNMEWANPNYDDSNWERLYVPSSWEEQGFHGYDGYAWYRLKVKLPDRSDKSGLYLKLGYIDDVDEVFINGSKIGQTGQFPPNYTTAYNANRNYLIPSGIINYSEEITIAVRVFDEGGEGGIVNGNVSFQIDLSSVNTDLNLSGEWKFRTGNCSGDPKNIDYKDWEDIFVPGSWENQGFKNYDGVACYAKEFTLQGQFTNKHMILLLGRIDDLDIVYLNGTLIGQSGEFSTETVRTRSDTYKQLRSYHIPSDLLNEKGKNVIIVKVYDDFGSGGIYEGSIGLISQKNYIQYWRERRHK
ncbi:MAG: glycoside hydrolase [Marinilabiliales bacterium]|nr:MAG: glycoside hydrolase [Marinilabiliales bacterium]